MLKCWNEVPGYKQFVTDKWRSFEVQGWGGFILQEKLKWIKMALKEWHRIHVSNLPGRIKALKERVADLDTKGEEEDLSVDELQELRQSTFDIHSLSRMDTSICWQQSRLSWLQDGDANSKYFHSIMAGRHRGNTISSLLVDGGVVEGVNPVRAAVFNYFADHFKNIQGERPSVEGLEFRRIDVMDGVTLVRPFHIDEVKAAVWDCDSYKTPGPDGVNFGFIKEFWSEMSGDIMRFVGDFHRNGKLTKGINSTFIALIPKVESPQKLNDFRPISLVGSLYKILAKILANRLKGVVGKLVSETQSAFVSGRQIMDGLLIANEAVDGARKLKKELLLFKVDFEKAYYSIDWKYLDAVMVKMGFPTLWRKWINECIGTASASVLVNGSPTTEFPLRRGLRQGDPLSPFLFLLAAEGLNVLMKADVDVQMFTGYKFGLQDGVSVSHLQFADDTLLVGEKSWANVRALQAVLLLFESVSGLKVNFHKSMLSGINICDS
jgi:hypothetical protein